MIEIGYQHINTVLEYLDQSFGEFTKQQTGRIIAHGAVSKAKWIGRGWIVWTDHFRTPDHGTVIKAYLSFSDSKNETVFRLKHPEVIV